LRSSPEPEPPSMPYATASSIAAFGYMARCITGGGP
jgi:hypothetical protein